MSLMPYHVNDFGKCPYEDCGRALWPTAPDASKPDIREEKCPGCERKIYRSHVVGKPGVWTEADYSDKR